MDFTHKDTDGLIEIAEGFPQVKHKAHPELTPEDFKQLANRERVERYWKCRYWEVKLRNLGECRVNPPTGTISGDGNGSFSLTHFLMWCGRFIQS